MTHPLPLRQPGFHPSTPGQEKLWALLQDEANRTLAPLQLCQKAGYQTTGPWYAALKNEAFRQQVEALGVLTSREVRKRAPTLRGNIPLAEDPEAEWAQDIVDLRRLVSEYPKHLSAADLVFVNDIGGQFRIRIGARDSFERVTAKQIWGPCDNEKGNHLAFDNEKGSHLWHISTSPCPNGVAQTVPESFLPPTVQRLSSCPVACPTSAAARYRVPDPRCGLLFQSHAKSRPRRRWGDRVRARSSWP